MKRLFLTIFLLTGTIISQAQENPGNFKNLHQVTDELYRSDQPGRKGFTYLEELDIRTVINLRHRQTDRKKVNHSSIKLIHYPLNTNRVNEQNLIELIQLIESSPKPVLIHCKHGSDRTGVTVAAYRIWKQDWGKEEAIAELRNPEFGYHEGWFPNLIELVSELGEPALPVTGK